MSDLVPINVRSELASEAHDTASAMATLRDFAITSTDDLAFAGDLLRASKDRWKALEDKRTAVTGPINAALREVQSWFRPIQEPLKEAERILKDKIASYTLAQRTAQHVAIAVAAAEIRAGRPADVSALAPAVALDGIAVRESWDFDIEDERLVPREYLCVDLAKIKATIWYADTAAPPRPIPGIRFLRRGQVRVT